jgi:hypothetical protein
VFIESVKNEHEVACRKAEAAQAAYLAEIKARGDRLSRGVTMGPRHRLAALKAAYHKASTRAENLAREVAELTVKTSA